MGGGGRFKSGPRYEYNVGPQGGGGQKSSKIGPHGL